MRRGTGPEYSSLLKTLVALYPLYKTIHHALFARLIKRDCQLIPVDRHHIAVAELLVKHPVADAEGRDRTGRFRHQLALDGDRQAARAAGALRAAAPRRDLRAVVVIDRVDMV